MATQVNPNPPGVYVITAITPPSTISNMIIYPLYTQDDQTPGYIGCVKSDRFVVVEGYTGRFVDRITEARRHKAFNPDPGMYIALSWDDNAALGDPKGIHGQLFTITDDGDLVQGTVTTSVPRLTTWPPKPVKVKV